MNKQKTLTKLFKNKIKYKKCNHFWITGQRFLNRGGIITYRFCALEGCLKKQVKTEHGWKLLQNKDLFE